MLCINVKALTMIKAVREMLRQVKEKKTLQIIH